MAQTATPREHESRGEQRVSREPRGPLARLIQRFVNRLPVDDEAGGRGPGYNPRLGGYQPGEDRSVDTQKGSNSSI